MEIMINISFLYLQSISIYKNLFIPLSIHKISLELLNIGEEMSNLSIFTKNAFSLYFPLRRRAHPAFPSVVLKTACLKVFSYYNGLGASHIAL